MTLNAHVGEDHYRQLVELSPDMMMLLDESGVIQYANLAAMDFLRVDSPQAILGRTLAEFLLDGGLEKTRSDLEQLLTASGESPLIELRIRRADGTWFHAELKATPYVQGEKHVVHVVVRDVTRRKEAEEARRKLRRQLFLTAAVLLLTLLLFGAYQGYQYTESTAFCGRACHSVMGPDMALHERSAHAHVSCAECHIGHGAAWYIKAKLSGLKQVYAMAARSYSRPIETPITNLRPAVETCEECHSWRVFYGNRDKIHFRYPEDGDLRDPEATVLQLHLGGYMTDMDKAAGIHWHAGRGVLVEYRASDAKRTQIREVRVTEKGKVRTFTRDDLPRPPETAPWRVMDCTDCHNRVAHRYESPEEAVDRLIFQGKLDVSIPEIKKAALAAVCLKYDQDDAARQGIRNSLQAYYQSRFPQQASGWSDSLAAAAGTLYELAYKLNVSPAMNIQWGTYTDLGGHRADGGCFRCHDGKHTGAAGKPISDDCGMCHNLLVNEQALSTIDEAVRNRILMR